MPASPKYVYRGYYAQTGTEGVCQYRVRVCVHAGRQKLRPKEKHLSQELAGMNKNSSIIIEQYDRVTTVQHVTASARDTARTRLNNVY